MTLKLNHKEEVPQTLCKYELPGRKIKICQVEIKKYARSKYKNMPGPNTKICQVEIQKYARSKYKYRSSNAVPSDHVTSPQSLLHEESVVDRFIKVAEHLVGNVDIT